MSSKSLPADLLVHKFLSWWIGWIEKKIQFYYLFISKRRFKCWIQNNAPVETKMFLFSNLRMLFSFLNFFIIAINGAGWTFWILLTYSSQFCRDLFLIYFHFLRKNKTVKVSDKNTFLSLVWKKLLCIKIKQWVIIY